MSEPSAYELERLANMAANQRQLEAMGLVEAADACREPSPPKKQPKKRKKAQPKRELPKRHSTRANGGSENLLALDAEISKEEREKRAAQLEAHLLSLDEPPPPPRHAGLPLKDGTNLAQAFDWQVPLTEAQRKALQIPDGWVDDFENWVAEFGGANRNPPSEQNVRNVMQRVRPLVAGEGYTGNYRTGTFPDPLRPITLREDLEKLQLEAFVWLPMNTLPPWMKGKPGVRAANGVGRCDRSNGWALNHPIGKMQYYQRWLHAKQTAKPKDVDQKALAALETEVAAAAKAADAEEEEEDDEEAEAEASPPAAPPPAAAPASKRQRVVAPPPPRGALAINAKVSARYKAYASGKTWHDGTITNVNENGTFQVTFDDGDFDEKVAPKHIRLL